MATLRRELAAFFIVLAVLSHAQKALCYVQCSSSSSSHAGTLPLSCSNGFVVLKVLQASFGTQSNCKEPISDQSGLVRSARAQHDIQDACQSRASCSVLANTWKEYTPKGENMSLTVVYECAPYQDSYTSEHQLSKDPLSENQPAARRLLQVRTQAYSAPTRRFTPSFSRKPSANPAQRPTPSRRTPTRSVTRANIPTRRHQIESPTIFCAECLTIQFGSAEFVKYPELQSWSNPDFSFTSVRLPNGDFRAYSGTGSTSLVVAGPKLENFLKPARNITLTAPKPQYYTHNLEGVWFDPSAGIIRGWVHVETYTCNDDSYFHGEIIYSQSVDGVNWNPRVATYYPPTAYKTCPIGGPVSSPDWCITSSGNYLKSAAEISLTKTKNSGTGAHYVIPIGDHLYMFYTDFWAEDGVPGPDYGTYTYGVCLARATKASGGLPGTWTKYYRGSFSTPGVGGTCTILTAINRSVGKIREILSTQVLRVPLVNTNAQYVYLGIPPSWAGTAMVHPDLGPQFLPASLEHMWGSFSPPLAPLTGSWPSFPYDQRPIAKEWFYGYTSLVTDQNDQVWMYAMVTIKGYPADWPALKDPYRSLVRWPLTMSQTSDNSRTCGAIWALTKYGSYISGDVRLTIQPVPFPYYKLSILGYVSTCYSGDGYGTLLSECRNATTGAHFLGRAEECRPGASSPNGSPSALVFVGNVGYVGLQPRIGLVSLYRCMYDSTYFQYMVGYACPSGGSRPLRHSALLGYIQSTSVEPGSPSVFQLDDPASSSSPSTAVSSPSSSTGALSIVTYVGIAVGVVAVAILCGMAWYAIRRRRVGSAAGGGSAQGGNTWMDLSEHAQVAVVLSDGENVPEFAEAPLTMREIRL